MDQTDRSVRKFVFDYFLAQTSAPSVEDIARGCRMDRPLVRAALQRLDIEHQLKLIDGTERILMAFPFSAVATPYRVTRKNGQRYFANCAWDAVAFHPMLQEPVEIDSFCRHCGNPIHFGLESGRGPSDGASPPIVHLALRASEWWNDIVRTCSNTMVFLESLPHLQAWREGESGPFGAALTVEQTVRLSAPIYGGKMDLGYARPPKEEIQAHFERLGLVGDFWQL